MSLDRTCPVLCVILVGLLMPQFVNADASPVNLTELGEWDIVTSPDAPPSEQYAAQELQQFLGQALGTELDIVHSPDQLERCIFVG